MADLSNSLNFTRINSDGVYYSDLEISLWRSVRFDVSDNNEQVATLITNNKKIFTFTKDHVRLSMKRKWSWQNKWIYLVFKEENNLLATIYIHRPIVLGWFRPGIYNITFEKTEFTYSLTERKKKHWKYRDADFCYDLTLNGATKCSIINLKKPKGFYNPNTIYQEGIIEYDNSINLEQIICFLQFVNINIDLAFDI